MNIHEELRTLGPQVLAIVARRSGDFAAAEDAVQEALVAAAAQWAEDGLPESPRGWLMHVARRRLVDQQRAEIARKKREIEVAPEDLVPAPDSMEVPDVDDSLLLLFMCCHPSLTRPSAIALTLRAVGGLTTGEIAKAFLVPDATMGQRISRAKQTIRDAGLRFQMPTAPEQSARLGAVMHVLYLIFNEGYASSEGPELLRVDLGAEAIRLARVLHERLPDDAEVRGLLALMLLTDARRAARTGPRGQLIPLDEQDRSLWDRAAITEGVALVTDALARGAVGPYQLQAAIAAAHDEAPSTDATDWADILGLYTVLKHMNDNPMVALNHAIAAAMVQGPAAGLSLLVPLDADVRLKGHYRLDAVRGHLLQMAGDRTAALRHYRAAADKTTSVPEREYLLRKAGRLS